jgi:hypothetical protein
LKEVSGYSTDAIWLFSVELFHKELKKYNLRVKAKNAESAQAIDEARNRAKAKQQAKQNR